MMRKFTLYVISFSSWHICYGTDLDGLLKASQDGGARFLGGCKGIAINNLLSLAFHKESRCPRGMIRR